MEFGCLSSHREVYLLATNDGSGCATELPGSLDIWLRLLGKSGTRSIILGCVNRPGRIMTTLHRALTRLQGLQGLEVT